MDYDIDPVWAPDFFPGFRPDLQQLLFNFMITTRDVANYLEKYAISLAIICVVINCFHFLILSRKQMRQHSANIIMLGVAFCDISVVVFEFVNLILEDRMDEIKCYQPLSYVYLYSELFLLATTWFFRRCVIWLAISMATIRTISIKNYMNHRFNFLSTPKCGWLTIFITSLPSMVVSILHFFSFVIVPQTKDDTGYMSDPKCLMNYTEKSLRIFNDFKLFPWYQIINGVTADIIPSIAFPILTIILVIELQKARIKRKKVVTNSQKQTEKTDRTTIVVTYIAATFMIAELPQGIFGLMSAFFRNNGFLFLADFLGRIFILVSLLNAITHSIVCYTLSSEYRKTAKGLFGCRNQTTPVQRISTSDATKKSISSSDVKTNDLSIN